MWYKTSELLPPQSGAILIGYSMCAGCGGPYARTMKFLGGRWYSLDRCSKAWVPLNDIWIPDMWTYAPQTMR